MKARNNTEHSYTLFETLLIAAKNVKLQEVCCQNTEMKVNGNACVYTSKSETFSSSTAAPRMLVTGTRVG